MLSSRIVEEAHGVADASHDARLRGILIEQLEPGPLVGAEPGT